MSRGLCVCVCVCVYVHFKIFCILEYFCTRSHCEIRATLLIRESTAATGVAPIENIENIFIVQKGYLS
jgi:hypothetical protein